MQTELKCLWDKCVTFHGHGCGGLAVGFRAVLYAWELFGSDRTSEDEEVVYRRKGQSAFQSTGKECFLLLSAFGRKVFPACLAPNTGQDQGGAAGVAHGWGFPRDV